MAILVSQSPSMDGQGVFFSRPESCSGRFWTGRAWRSPVLDRSGSEKSVPQSIWVDGCGRSAYGVVVLAERKRVVFVSKKSKNRQEFKIVQNIQDRHSQVELSTS